MLTKTSEEMKECNACLMSSEREGGVLVYRLMFPDGPHYRA